MTHPFYAIHSHGFVRVAACTPRVAVGDPAFNADETLRMAEEGQRRGCDLMLFPELGLSAYAIDDLFLQDALLRQVEAQIGRVVEASAKLKPVLVVGAPVGHRGRLYNSAVVISRGRILGVVPKSFLPNYREYYENRWFSPGAGVTGLTLRLAGQDVPFGTDLVFEAEDLADFTFAAEICEDFWSPAPPSTQAALAGALILCNLSASNIVVGKADDRAILCASQSMRATCAYLYSAAGPGESTTDLAWDGQASIYELGRLLARTERFPSGSQMAVADIDVERLRLERLRTPTFSNAAVASGNPERATRYVRFAHKPTFEDIGLERPLDRFPFVPDDPARLDQDCYEAFNIQVQGLLKRLQATRSQHITIGVSGGLDSTHALIVAAKAFDAAGLPRKNILGFTMPGFATSEGTKSNAWALMNALGITGEEIDIKPAARQMLSDMGHPFAKGEPVYDVTFENVQAGLRTDYLFRLANQRNGFVLGTGDLSELALGWCTYGVGDQMSHYNVNGSVPKTLIQHLIRWVANTGQFDKATSETLLSVLGQKSRPNWFRRTPKGLSRAPRPRSAPTSCRTSTSFTSRASACAPRRWRSWPGRRGGTATRAAGRPTSRPKLGTNTTSRPSRAGSRSSCSASSRSASSSARPCRTGPKVISGGNLSPRGDWRAPSDGTARVWLEELDANVP